MSFMMQDDDNETQGSLLLISIRSSPIMREIGTESFGIRYTIQLASSSLQEP